MKKKKKKIISVHSGSSRITIYFRSFVVREVKFEEYIHNFLDFTIIFRRMLTRVTTASHRPIVSLNIILMTIN